MKTGIIPLTLVAIMLLAVIAGGCTNHAAQTNNSTSLNEHSLNGSGTNASANSSAVLDIPVEAAAALNKFNSTSEIQAFLAQNTLSTGIGYDNAVMPNAEVAPVPAPASSGVNDKTSSTAYSSLTNPGYSTTNVQVTGVDEPDFVKNDGKYIYTISNNQLVIINAYPAAGAKIVSTTTFNGSATNLFLNGDQLVIFSSGNMVVPQVYNNVYAASSPVDGSTAITAPATSGIAIMPPYRYNPETHALVYSIADRSKPRLEKDINVTGSYFDARMIGDWVYMITKTPVSYYDNPIAIPMVSSGQGTVIQPDVYYFRAPDTSYVFHTITAFNVNGGTGVQAKTFLMGQTNTMYVSSDNIYISYPLYSQIYPQPLYASTASGSLSGMEDTFNNMSEADKQSYLNNLNMPMIRAGSPQTVIHKIAIGGGSINYVGKGVVNGTLLNQFSMDENGNMLRVATTASALYYNSGTQQYNNVYILDKDMHTTGSLEGIAPGERIYSARFIGDRLYLVTYKNVDPLFVIDLSNVNKPKILGELNMTGYSNFLYPYDATHIIGIGRETTDNTYGGTVNSGIKIAMFDVSDVNNPKLVDKYEIGNSQTYSEALSDHKAILLDPAKGILVIPVSQWSNQPVIKSGSSYITSQYWNGAYVFGLSTSGFTVKGSVSQDDNSSYGMESVRRALYIDNDLYTISAQKVVISDLGNLGKLGEIKLPGNNIIYPPQPMIE